MNVVNLKPVIAGLLALVEKQAVELDPKSRSIARIEMEDGLPEEIIRARVALAQMGGE